MAPKKATKRKKPAAAKQVQLSDEEMPPLISVNNPSVSKASGALSKSSPKPSGNASNSSDDDDMPGLIDFTKKVTKLGLPDLSQVGMPPLAPK